MNIKENKIIKNLWIAFLIVAIFWPLAFINKGIDLTDTGYYLANYSHIFNSIGETVIGTFLSNYFGGLIYSVIPSHHLMVLKIICMLTNGISIMLAFFVLKKHFQKNILAFFMMVSSFIFCEMPQCPSYNTFSFLLLSLIIFLLVKWTDTQKNLFLILSGVIIGFSVFFRIPNVLFGCLYAAVLWYDIMTDRKKEILKDTWRMFWGGMVGLLTGVGIILRFVGMDGILKDFNRYTNVATTSQNSHSITITVKRFGLQILRGTYEHILFLAVASVLLAILVFFLYKYKKTGKDAYSKMAICTIVVINIAAIVLNTLKFDSVYNQTEMVEVILLPVSFFSVWYYRKKDISLSILSCILMIVSLVVFFGTDTGFRIHIVGHYWFLPYTVLISVDYMKKFFDAKELTCKRAIVLACCIALVSNVVGNNIFRSTKMMCTYQYREPYDNINYYPNSSVLAGVRTTEYKCRMLDGVTCFLEDDKYKDKKIIVMMSPIIFALVDNECALGRTFWPDLESYSTEKFESSLQQFAKNDDLPIVILTYHMPSKRVSYLETFCEENNYTVADEDILNGEKIYTILVP